MDWLYGPRDSKSTGSTEIERPNGLGAVGTETKWTVISGKIGYGLATVELVVLGHGG